MTSKIKRICHRYQKWEDWKNNMWSKPTKQEHDQLLPSAIEFISDHKLYGSWMKEVTNNWTNACEHNLTDLSINRKAWIGHAAVCLAIKIPKVVTRMAWWYLSDNQRDMANKEADRVIKEWETKHLKSRNKQRELF